MQQSRLGDLGYEGVSGTITVAFKKPKNAKLKRRQQQLNKAHNGCGRTRPAGSSRRPEAGGVKPTSLATSRTNRAKPKAGLRPAARASARGGPWGDGSLPRAIVASRCRTHQPGSAPMVNPSAPARSRDAD